MICTKLLIRKTLFYLEVKLCKLRTLKLRYMHLSIFQFYGSKQLECCKIRLFINYANHNLCWKLNYRDWAFHVWSPIYSTNTLAANKSIWITNPLFVNVCQVIYMQRGAENSLVKKPLKAKWKIWCLCLVNCSDFG